MKKIMLSILAIILVFSALTGCSSSSKEVLYIFNWGDFIDMDLVRDFEKEYGIKVIYDEYDTNESMYARLKAGGKYDLIFPSDYMIAKLISEDMLEEIDFNNIPNYKYIMDNFKNMNFDPENKYSVPYVWGTLGILYNTEKVQGNVDSWSVVFDPANKNQVFMIDSMRDTLAVALNYLGYSINSKNEQELEEAKRLLIKQRSEVNPVYVNDEGKDMIMEGQAVFFVTWSGEAMQVISEDPRFHYIVPKEGSNLFIDNMAIPKGARNKENAEKFINYMLRPDVAKANIEYIGYSTPHKAAWEGLDTETKNNPILYLSDEVIKKAEIFIDLGPFLDVYSRVWREIKNQ
ncbi:spermidine/putrescine transport system substrate-binding protein [Anaerobranca californiensis DSM 14826]|uniref:Spermidine/putrescine transport system substrate-binding protein n=1 Tax=Anaerobranca californiensis DSM 14826 TaxID=1120989 RepID=A0A1M6MW41_9FIRM|nr:spermidine/putrescine ABC transporter substrate-binding protein [Anaerobranca californiensis]SHJ87691.1 spermidine/putrescine transport system substrate-binding protein [Anaerobranca californiensis DSM 14826]